MIKQKKKTRLKTIKQTRKKEREWGENKAKFERKRKRN